jgi:hypothetical protein
MDIGQYVTQLREDLVAAAGAGDEQTQRTAALLGAAIEPAARLAVMNALSDLAGEVTEALGDRTVEVRLDGRDVRVAVSGTTPQDGPRFPPPTADAGDISRITLRMVEQIKAQAEQAAQQQGVSLNSWVSQAVQGALAGRQRRHRGGPEEGGDGRLKGWVQG